ncbi:hypothetical protein J6590_025206 [Homalodisca vitripennis]|nr:hypothetical protein J6590_025206 [Homalodisca vitripennis]
MLKKNLTLGRSDGKLSDFDIGKLNTLYCGMESWSKLLASGTQICWRDSPTRLIVMLRRPPEKIFGRSLSCLTTALLFDIVPSNRRVAYPLKARPRQNCTKKPI